MTPISLLVLLFLALSSSVNLVRAGGAVFACSERANDIDVFDVIRIDASRNSAGTIQVRKRCKYRISRDRL